MKSLDYDKIKIGLTDNNHPFPFKINIECEVNNTCDIDDLIELQGDLKTRSEIDVIKILKSIRNYGFSFPFFYWQSNEPKKYILDGHGRKFSLNIYRALGGNVPKLPIIRINAKNKKEAKQKLLRMDSKYGKINQSGFDEFISDIEVDFNEITFTGIDITDFCPDLNEQEDNNKKQITCPKCGFCFEDK